MRIIHLLSYGFVIGALLVSCSSNDKSGQTAQTNSTTTGVQSPTIDQGSVNTTFTAALADATTQNTADTASAQDALFGNVKCQDGSALTLADLPPFMSSLAKAHTYIHQLVGVGSIKTDFSSMVDALKAAKTSATTPADFKTAIAPILAQFQAQRETEKTNFEAALAANKTQLEALNAAIKAVHQACTVRGPKLGEFLKPIGALFKMGGLPSNGATTTTTASGANTGASSSLKLCDGNEGFEDHGMMFNGGPLYCPIPADLSTEIQTAIQTKQTAALAQAKSAACTTASAALDVLTAVPLPTTATTSSSTATTSSSK